MTAPVLSVLSRFYSILQNIASKALFTRHKLTQVGPGLKLTQVVFTRHFSKLTRVEPGLVVFTRQTNPGRTRVSSVYTTN